MASPGTSLSPILSPKDKAFFTSEAPQALWINTPNPEIKVSLLPSDHVLTPMMGTRRPGNAGVASPGVEWISVRHLNICGEESLKLIHNAQGIIIRPRTSIGLRPDHLQGVKVTCTLCDDLYIHAPGHGIEVPQLGRYFPPGALQILLGPNGLPVSNASTTLPAPVQVKDRPCTGWCSKNHIYVNRGLEERAVVFFNSAGWPIAVKENISQRACWWRFDYSRPQPRCSAI
jgi:hypothetical protein